jgi:hypothetical protein
MNQLLLLPELARVQQSEFAQYHESKLFTAIWLSNRETSTQPVFRDLRPHIHLWRIISQTWIHVVFIVYFPDQGLSCFCEVGIELSNLEPLKISGEIVDYDINPKAQENDHPLPQDEDGEVTEFSRLGGLLKSYRRVKKAA